jgi:hypothetical protein
MMDYEKYENRLTYPDRSEMLTAKEKEFDNTQTGTINELRLAKAEFMRTIEQEYREAQNTYRAENRRLHHEVFKEDLRQDYNHGQKIGDLIFERAWADGHSSGLHEVAGYYEELSDFVDKILEAYNSK